MPVICGDFGSNLPFTGNLQEISGLLYPTSTEFREGGDARVRERSGEGVSERERNFD